MGNALPICGYNFNLQYGLHWFPLNFVAQVTYLLGYFVTKINRLFLRCFYS